MIPGRRSETIAFSFLLVSIIVVSLLWPGDHFWGKPGTWQTIFWNYPEQIETIRTAMQANQYHEPAVTGVRGSMPIVYHPFHVWGYQLLLQVTSELTAIVFFKQLFTLIVCLSGLFYLARSLEYPAYPVLLLLFSPFFYIYSRQLSDDPWLIPLSLMAVCCYAAFVRKPRWFPVIIGTMVLLMLFFVHPRGLLPAMGLVTTFFLFEYRWIKRHLSGVALLLIIALILVSPTIKSLFGQLHVPGGTSMQSLTPLGNEASNLVDTGIGASWLNGVFPLISGGMFYSYDFLTLLPAAALDPGRLHPSIVRLLGWVSMFAYVLVVSGLLLTLGGLFFRKRKQSAVMLEDRLGVASLLMIVFFLVQVVLFLALGKFYPPDYHAGVWFAYFYLIWRTTRNFHQKRWFLVAMTIYITAIGLLWSNMILTVHNTNDYDLGRGIRLAKQIASCAPQSDVVLMVDFTAEMAADLDDLSHNATRSLLGFYYKPYIREIKLFVDKMSRHHSNLLSYALHPLVLHYRQVSGIPDAAPRTVIVKRRRENGLSRLVVEKDRQAVDRELRRSGPPRQE